MSDTAALLSSLRERDVRLWIEDGRLRCSAPRDALDAGMKAALSSRKDEILAILRQADAVKSLPPGLLPIRSEGSKPTIFAVSGHGGDAFCFRALSRQMDPDQPLFAVQPPGLDGGDPLTTVEDLARFEIDLIRRYRPNGPYLIAGHCSGGTLAFEVARQLTEAGQEVALLALIGSPFPTSFLPGAQLMFRLERHAKALTTGSLASRWAYVMSKLRPPEDPEGITPETMAARQRVDRATVAAVREYKPRPYAGQIDLFITADRWHRSHQWRPFAGTLRERILGPYEVNELMIGHHGQVLAAALRDAVRECLNRTPREAAA